MSRMIPYIKLVGDELENFYQLGVRDKIGHKALYKQANELMPLHIKSDSNLIKKLGMELIGEYFRKKSSFFKKVEAYAEGLELPPKDLLLTFLVPDILGSLNAIANQPLTPLFGCSSLFFYDEKTETPSHLRVLDFPLLGSFDKNERLVKTQFGRSQSVLSYNSIGIPFSGPTSMNEAGVTLAIHQHFGNQTNLKSGLPIFELGHEFIQKVHTLSEAKSFLSKNRPISTWSFLCSFSDGKVLRSELTPKESFFTEYQLKPDQREFFYFCNKLSHQKESPLLISIDQYNEMREKSAVKKISKLKKLKVIDAQNVLRNISQPLTVKGHSKNWNLDLVTPTSLQVCVMQPNNEQILLNSAQAPRFNQGEFIQGQSLWKTSLTKFAQVKTKGKPSPQKFQRGYRELALAQNSYQEKNLHLQFHHIQMAKHYLKDYPDWALAQFFFLVFSALEAGQARHYKNLHQKFLELLPLLPAYYCDHAHIFLQRLSLLLGESYSTKHQFHSSRLKKVFEVESTLPWTIFKSFLKLLTHPRVDLFDIFYLTLNPETLSKLKSLIKI